MCAHIPSVHTYFKGFLKEGTHTYVCMHVFASVQGDFNVSENRFSPSRR